MASAGVWCLTESDPGVFSGLIRDIGVEGVQVEELYLPEKEALIPLRPVFGLIFLFKWTGEKDSRPCETDNPDVFFARQVITNACATQAILSILLNRREISLGQTLGDFLEFTRDLDPEMRGVALSNSDRIREVHNSYARVDSLMFDDGESKSGKKEDAFHFISYVPIHGALYELDGLKPGPINLGPCTDEDWEEKCLEVIRERMNKYQQSSTEIRFNLMAVVQDRIQLATQKLDVLNPRLDQLRRKVQALQAGGQFGEENGLPSSVDELLGMKVALEDERHALHDEIEAEKLKRQRYQRENERRRHNFIPLIHALLVAMADKGKLLPLIESSKTKPSKPSSK